ncbi:C39 family peptidase [Paenibacillus sp. IHBB 10380]|uniref:C39 family peptidase n=1 Tax=Paenibacillus sp. IHBB 10380 TaxID=1566358 RepID=UPI0005CFC573|nr:C39 family peptidase [Paenibacillus sp. IHBB 10380]AJS57309.1 hypothetical protein UB51_01010 [Paenibacillus sp. IHBB 10380]
MKKFILTLVLSAMMVITPLSAFADDSQTDSTTETSSVYEQAADVASKYIDTISLNTPDWQNSSLTFKYPLVDFNGQLTSFLFAVNSEDYAAGYIIVSADNPTVLESTREGEDPYRDLVGSEEQAVYIGATQYYIKKDESTYYDVRQEKIMNRDEFLSNGFLQGESFDLNVIPEKNTLVVENPSLMSEIAPATIISYSSKKISSVPDITWRKGCSPTSFGNIIRYWKNNGYSSLLASSTTDDTLVDVLASSSYMNTNSAGGTGWDDRVNGMKKFWSDRGYTVSVSRGSANFNTHKTEMNANRPDIINVVNDATYSDHDMTGVGYEEYQDTDQNLKWFRYVIVHDTWSNTPTDVYLYMPQLSWNETVKVVPQ